MITVKATEAVDQIVLHFFDMDVKSYSFVGGQTILFNSTQYNPQYDKWTIPIKLSKDEAQTLTVDYTGYMRDDMRGFYKSYYKEGEKKIWMGTTQFQPVHARRAFPCFDVRFFN